jgi:DNA-binding NarL/FixJ family response regulator
MASWNGFSEASRRNVFGNRPSKLRKGTGGGHTLDQLVQRGMTASGVRLSQSETLSTTATTSRVSGSTGEEHYMLTISCKLGRYYSLLTDTPGNEAGDVRKKTSSIKETVVTPISVIIADDHPIVRDGLVAVLSLGCDIHVAGVAASFPELRTLLQSTTADVIVLDIGNMGAPPISSVAELVRMYPNMAIIVFSSTAELAPELLYAGVKGYVIKEDRTKHLHEAIMCVLEGETFLSTSVQEYLERCEAQPGQARMTPAQLTVLRFLSLNYSTREIAQALNLDEGTIYNYVLTLKQKTGCRSRKELSDWYSQVYGS